jgi:hypothetical protein
MNNQLIQQEILYKLNAKNIAKFGILNVKSVVDSYVDSFPPNLKFIIANYTYGRDILADRSNEWANDVLDILNKKEGV